MSSRETLAIGALVGWARAPSEHGTVLTVQIARDVEAFATRRLEVVRLALNDRQLRSLTRDLERAARERGIELHAQPRRRMQIWRALFGRPRRVATPRAAVRLRGF